MPSPTTLQKQLHARLLSLCQAFLLHFVTELYTGIPDNAKLFNIVPTTPNPILRGFYSYWEGRLQIVQKAPTSVVKAKSRILASCATPQGVMQVIHTLVMQDANAVMQFSHSRISMR